MKYYSVKQIAEMLQTNPETVRRWIREKKLIATQVSRKNGNIVSEHDLKYFLNSMPKYLSKVSPAIGALSPIIGLGTAVVGGTLLGGFFYNLDKKTGFDLQISSEELQNYIQESIRKLHVAIEQKQLLIKQTETEIEEIQQQIKQLSLLLKNNKDLLIKVKLQKEKS